ncbi:MAG: RNA-binding protein [Leptospira sp.]|nr:RNA-binding protein [Leptospira sp.]
MKISIGNLPQSLTEDQLKALLSPFGTVTSLTIKRDKITKVSLGFGSADMDEASALKAIAALNGKEVEGKKIAVVKQEDLANQHNNPNSAKSSPMNQKSPFGKAPSTTGASTGVQRRGGQRGS